MTAMLVETFEVTEVDADGHVECEVEALALIESLGLEGQQKLISTRGDGEPKRCPYRKMTIEERLVYRTLCPKESKLREFSDSPIPVRVLQVAAHSVDLFQNVVVWSAENSDIKDPVLVGRNTAGYVDEFFMLARWGEVLETFEKLFAMAVAKVRKDRTAKLRAVAAECQAKADMTEVMPDLELLKCSSDPHLSDYGSH